MERTRNGKSLSETYWSVAEYADQASEHADRILDRLTPDRHDWADVDSMGEALSLAKDGWNDELPAALELAESAVEVAIKDHMVDSFNQPVWDVTGAQVDVGAFLAGTPECMIDYPLSKTSHAGRVVTLVCGLCVSGAVSTRAMVKRGQVMTALALALSRLGHSVEIWIDVNGDKSGYEHYQRVLVKGASDELDPAAIMFALAHPAMFRAIGLGTWDGYPGHFKTLFSENPGRGRVGTRNQAQRELYPDGTIFTNGLESGSDVPDADMFLRKYLGELGLLAE